MASKTTIEETTDVRVVVTGLGVISGCGIGHEDFFDACLEGRSSIDRVERFDASNMPCQIASEVPDDMFSPNDWFTNPKNVKSNENMIINLVPDRNHTKS